MTEYKLIKNTPCSEDLFEGKSHTAIAKQICNVVQEDENCKMIETKRHQCSSIELFIFIKH